MTEVSEEHNHEISKVNLSVVSVYSVCACVTRSSACIFTILNMCMSVCRESCIYTMYCMHYSTCVGGGPVIVEDESTNKKQDRHNPQGSSTLTTECQGGSDDLGMCYNSANCLCKYTCMHCTY